MSSNFFPFLATKHFLAKVKEADALFGKANPLGRQVYPSAAEIKQKKNALIKKNKRLLPWDAVGDLEAYNRTSATSCLNGDGTGTGLLQKYEGRVLLLLTGKCACHCRYCFRQHFPYHEKALNMENWHRLQKQLANDCSIREVILSGGDPLMVNDTMLQSVVEGLASIPHLTTLRVHSRLPVFLPSRFTENFYRSFDAWHGNKVFVVHVNHAAELDEKSKVVFTNLKNKGWMLLNQAVLLKGVNDNLTALQQLSFALFAQGVLPYYLHQLDVVVGVRHFYVAISTGRTLIKALRKQLPGYLVPRYVVEKKSKPYKVPL